MKKLITLTALLALTLAAVAGERGPQYSTTRVTTNLVIGTVCTIPIGDTGRFTPQYVVIRGRPAAVTNAVLTVNFGVTNTFSAATTGTLITLTNIPTMFYGDAIIVKPNQADADNTNMYVTVIGTVFD